MTVNTKSMISLSKLLDNVCIKRMELDESRHLSKFSSGLSSSETITATVSLIEIADLRSHKYSICSAISEDVGSMGIVRNTKTFTIENKKINNKSSLLIRHAFNELAMQHLRCQFTSVQNQAAIVLAML